MRRVLVICVVLLAAYRLPLAAAAPVSEDVPVAPVVSAMADSLGLEAARHPATFVADLVHLIYGPDVRSTQALAQLRGRRRPAGLTEDAVVLVPVPLSSDIWSRVVFRRTTLPRDLLAAIVSDRRAALLCHGLAGLDDETLTFLEAHPDVLVDLYEHLSPAFGAFGSSLRIHSGRVVPPGAALSVSLWEAEVGAGVDHPDRFIHALYGDHEGRVAYLYDTISELDAAHVAFTTGAWIDDEAVRRERFAALVAAMAHGYREWPVNERPFVRPLNDFAILVSRLAVDESGTPGAPASRAFWNDVFQTAGAGPAPSERAEHGLIDAAYLAEATGVGDMYTRSDRCEQLSFAQRVFARSADDKDAVVALKAMPRLRMLMLSLERMGIRRPSVYVAASRGARDATTSDANRAFWTLAQLQGALALVGRLHAVGTIDTAAAERLVISLSAVPLVDGKYAGGVARWIEHDLMTVLPAADSVEARLALGLSGRENNPSDPHIVWEGQEYRLDFGASNAHRLHAVREKQGGYSMDTALDLARLAARQRAPVTAGDGHTTARGLAAVAGNFSPTSKNALVETMAPGVVAPTSARERIDRALADLERVDERREPERAARATEPLVDVADTALSEALLSLVYALDIGDPDGTALLAANIALRHDFGFTLHEGEVRARRPWDMPRQELLPDVPWHVAGSLLGLDIALAPLALKHIDLERSASAPRLRSIEREAFAVNVALLDQSLLHDRDRATVVAAIARGKARVESLTPDGDISQVADSIRMDGWRRRTLRWTLVHQRADVPALFSLLELMTIGGGAPTVNLNAWGLAAHLSTGCLCTHMPEPGGWRLYEGRPQLAFLSFVVPDLNLRIASVLEELHLPAALESPVLFAAMQDLIDEAAPSDANDWLSVAQDAQALTRQRIEDYVAAAAAVNGPLVPIEERHGKAAMKIHRVLLSLGGCVVAAAVVFGAQAGQPTVTITSPEAGSYANGPITLHARIEPQADVVNVTFFIDGRQHCVVGEWPFECEWDAGENITEHQVRAVVGLKGGARVAASIRTKALKFDDKVDVPAVQVTVTVTDDAGHFVSGLPRSAFHVSEDGVKQTITNFASEDVPLELISAVDISGSMAPSMPQLKKAVKDFLAALPAKNQVTLLGFNDTIFPITRKSTDPADRVKAVDRLSAWGATALYDVIAESVNMLGRQVGRKALVVFSDGEDQGSHVAINDVERRLQSSDMTLYMIGEGRGTSVERLKRVMDRLASPTGGRAFTTDSIEELHLAFDELLDELSHQYLLGYQSTNAKRDDAWREIKVDVDGHHTVRARQGYRAALPK